MRICLFLGAGFSAPFGLPMMNTFFRFVTESNRIAADEKALLDDVVIEARQANSFLQSSPTNLEDVLSFVVMGDRLSLQSKQRSQRIRRILQRVFTTVSASVTSWDRSKRLEGFLGFDPMDRKHELGVVTTNYDMMAECVMYTSGLRPDPCIPMQRFRDARRTSPDGFYTTGGTPLLKLHGSANWFFNPKSPGSPLVDDRISMLANHIVPNVCFEDADAQLDSIILPPSFLKPELPAYVLAVWAKAAEWLSSTELLVFVGYSFPETDNEMAYFLACALVRNARLRAIRIVDPHATAIVTRLRESRRYGSHFKDLLQAEDGPWEATRLNVDV